MIPRIQTGISFAGAGLYYLHDKREEGDRDPLLSTDRVAWTYTVNCVHDEAEAALEEMWQTVQKAPQLKALAGLRGGAEVEKPVMTIALSWSPDQAPTREDMIGAGLRYLDHMRWLDHQAVFIAHDDTPHAHIHVILNRVHPDTGLVLDDSFSKTRTQQWALAYEREQGRIYCEARAARYERGERSPSSHMERREWALWQEVSRDGRTDPEFGATLQAGEWDALKSGQRAQRDAFWKETKAQGKELRVALKESVKEEFAPEWVGYNAEKTKLLEEKQFYDREVRRAIKSCHRLYHAKEGKARIVPGRTGQPYHVYEVDGSAKMIRDIRTRQQAYHARIREVLKAQRDDIHRRQLARIEDLATPAFRHLRAERAAMYEKVKTAHRSGKAELRREQKAGTRRYDVLPGAPASPRSADEASRQDRTAPHIRHALSAVERGFALPGTKREMGLSARTTPLRLSPEQRRAADQLVLHFSVTLPAGSERDGTQRSALMRPNRAAANETGTAEAGEREKAGKAFRPVARATGGRRDPVSTTMSAEEMRVARDGLVRQLSFVLPPGSSRTQTRRDVARIERPDLPQTSAPPRIQARPALPNRRWSDAALEQQLQVEQQRAARERARPVAKVEVTQPKEITDRLAATVAREQKDALVERTARRAGVDVMLAQRAARRRSGGIGDR